MKQFEKQADNNWIDSLVCVVGCKKKYIKQAYIIQRDPGYVCLFIITLL